MVIITSNIYSQQTEKYKELISNLNPIDSMEIIKKNKKGVLKVQGKNIVYECNGEYLSFIKGKYLEYYNNGNLNQLGIYDKIGTLTYGKKYNRKGQLQSELIATKIDSKTLDLCDFLTNYDYLTIHLTENYYKYSKKIDSTYIYKTIYYIDGEKIKIVKFDKPNSN